jgi:hypothetical protein
VNIRSTLSRLIAISVLISNISISSIAAAQPPSREAANDNQPPTPVAQIGSRLGKSPLTKSTSSPEVTATSEVGIDVVNQAGEKHTIPVQISSSEAERAAANPNSLRKIKLTVQQGQMAASGMCRGMSANDILQHPAAFKTQGLGKETLLGLPMDTVPFWVASALVEHYHSGQDPAFWTNFINQNVTTTAGLASMVGFSLVNRASHRMFKTMGLSYVDPCDPNVSPAQKAKILARVASGQGLEPSKGQKIFQHLAGPLSLSFGMFGSGLIAEAINDQDLRTCAKTLGERNVSAEIEASCDRAYRNWTVGQKAADHSFSLLNAFVIPFIQAGGQKIISVSAGFANAKAGEWQFRGGLRYMHQGPTEPLTKMGARLATRASAPLLLRGIYLAGTYLNPVVMMGVNLLHLTSFIVMNHYSMQMWGPAWDNYRLGNIVTYQQEKIETEMASLDQSKNWLNAESALYTACGNDSQLVQKNSKGRLEVRKSRALDPKCKAYQTERALFEFGESNKQWRTSLLGPTSMLHERWKSYLLNFFATYSSSRNIYQTVLSNIAYQNHHEKKGEEPSPLYSYDWMNGLVQPEDLAPLSTAVDDQEKALIAKSKLQQALIITQKHITSLTSGAESYLSKMSDGENALKYLREIESGLIAAKDIKTVSEINQAILGKLAQLKKVRDQENDGSAKPRPSLEAGISNPDPQSEAEAKAEIAQVRQKAFEYNNKKFARLSQALMILSRLVHGDARYSMLDASRYTESNLPRDLGFLKMAPFFGMFHDIKKSLGANKPQAEGMSYLLGLEEDPQIVLPDNRNAHPTTLDRVMTPRMVDFALASMVCGPEANLTSKQKVEAARPIPASRIQNSFNYIKSLGGLLGSTSTEPKPESPFVRPQINTDEEASPSYRSSETSSLEDLKAYDLDQNALDIQSAKKPAPEAMQDNVLAREEMELLYFLPPRVVSLKNNELCSQLPKRIQEGFNASKFSGIDIHSSSWNIGGESFNGLLSVVKKFYRTELAAPHEPDFKGLPAIKFNDWWDAKVQPIVQHKAKQFRKQYTELLNDKFFPAFNKAGHSTYNGHKFANGIRASLADELELYLTMAVQIEAKKSADSNNPATPSAGEATLRKATREILVRSNLGLQLTAGLNEAKEAVKEIFILNSKDSNNTNIKVPTQSELDEIDVPWHGKIYQAQEKNSRHIRDNLQNLKNQLTKTMKLPEDRFKDLATQRLTRRLIESIERTVSEADQYFSVVNTLNSEKL